jgi:hypothetical protein
MSVIDSILNEWSYRCSDGIVDMNNPTKRSILDVILKENGVELDEKTSPRSAKYFAQQKQEPEVNTDPENKAEDKNTWEYVEDVLKNEADIKDDILSEIKAIYLASDPATKVKFHENFRKFNINQIDDIFSIFKDYINVGSGKTGIGKGEYTTILGLENSRSGGTSEKDIHVGSDIYDVKELAAGQFRTGNTGSITNTPFQKNLNYLLSLLEPLMSKGDNESIKEGKKKGASIDEKIQSIIGYYNNAYKRGNISKGVLDDIREITEALNKKEIESKGYVKVNDKKFEIDKIISNEKGIPTSIALGLEIGEEKAINLKLKNHPWVKDPSNMDNDFNNIWVEYIKDIKGLIIYDKGEIKFYNQSQLKDEFNPVRVVMNQIVVAKKGTPDNKITEDDDTI